MLLFFSKYTLQTDKLYGECSLYGVQAVNSLSRCDYHTLMWSLYFTVCITSNFNSTQDFVLIHSVMVLISNGNLEHVAHAWRKIGNFSSHPICDCSLSNHMPWTDQITRIASYVRIYFWLPSNINTQSWKKILPCNLAYSYSKIRKMWIRL